LLRHDTDEGNPVTGRYHRQRVPPEKIILFGSHARGQSGPDSDVDLLVLMPYVGHPARKAAEIVNRTHPGTFSLDVIVRTLGEFLERQKMRDWFMRDIAREGKVLYAA
jgi:predicted nucleotidyltransferase